MGSNGDMGVGRASAVIYTLLSLGIAMAFAVAATVLGKYTPVAIYGGAAWVFLLSMIVTMPTVTPLVARYAASRTREPRVG